MSPRYLLLALCVAIAPVGGTVPAQAVDTVRYIRLRDSAIEELKGPYEALAAQYHLGELSADDANYVPDSILAALVIGDRVYLVFQSLLVKLPSLSDCDGQWQTSADLDAAASAFQRCYARGVTSKPSYKAAVAQAQLLVNSFGR